MIPLFKVRLQKDLHKKLKPIFDSGYIGEGEQVKKFEKLLSDYYGGYVVLVNSGTSALHLAYHMSEVSGGEVISTPMTCMATNTPIVQNGAKIVWADIEPETGNISLESIKSLVTPKTRAVSIVHYGGSICDPNIKKFCDSKGISIVEDCAHLQSNGLGGIQCYSFQAIKFVTTGDGGCLVTQDKKIYDRAKLLRWYGIDREAGKDMRCMNPVYEVGYKFHMNDINATIGIENFKDIDKVLRHVQKIADIYNNGLIGLNHVRPVRVRLRSDYWLYILMSHKKQEFMDYLRLKDVATSLVHARNDIQPIFRKYKKSLPGLEEFWSQQFCIPIGWWVSEKDAEYIVDKIVEYDAICAY